MADVLTLWSATADFSAAVPDFPGVFDRDVWDAQSQDATKFYGTNGTYLQTGTGSTYTQAGGIGFLSVGSSTGVEAGMYVYLVFSGVNVDGYFRVISVTDATNIVVNATALESGTAATVEDLDVDYYIGGVSDALDSDVTLQAELDAAGTDYATGDHNVDILCHASNAVVLAATIDIDNITGSTTTRARLIGTNSSFVVDGTQVIIDTATTLALGLFDITNASMYLNFENIDFDGGNKTDDAVYCVHANSADDGQFSLYLNCKFHGASFDGAYVRSGNTSFIKCEFSGNGRHGYFSVSTIADLTIQNCISTDNISTGISVRTADGVLLDNNRIYDNDGIGIDCVATCRQAKISNNTIYSNGDDGILVPAGYRDVSIFNNTISGHSTGDGVNFNGDGVAKCKIFANNHSFGNDQYTDDITSSAEWEALGQGNNIVGDPLFSDPTTPAWDFIPLSSPTPSPLIDAGVSGTGDTIGALCATAGGGGGVNLLTGLLT